MCNVVSVKSGLVDLRVSQKLPKSNLEKTMIYQTDCIVPDELLKLIAQQGLSVPPDTIRTVVNSEM